VSIQKIPATARLQRDRPPKTLHNGNSGVDSTQWANIVKQKLRPTFTSGQELKIVDLFAGCGGLSLGTIIASSRLGRTPRIKLAADSWGAALDVYRSNMGDLADTIDEVDISKFVTNPRSVTLSPMGIQFASKAGEIDLLVAGPPCQGHSDLNNSSRRSDPRNLLYTVPVAFGIKTRAKIIIIENVPTVVHSTEGIVDASLEALKKNGYAVSEILADAQAAGLAQKRRRHLLVASKLHTEAQLKALLSCLNTAIQNVSISAFIGDLEDEEEDGTRITTKRTKISPENQRRLDFLFDNELHDLPNEHRPPCHRDKKHSYVSMYGRLKMNTPAQTITSGFGSMGQGRYIHPTRRRLITAHEAARLQGFPDYFSFDTAKSISSIRKFIANAVPPPLASILVEILLKN
jgi:DNA (cytosine-5)-methyltransferase 1